MTDKSKLQINETFETHYTFGLGTTRYRRTRTDSEQTGEDREGCTVRVEQVWQAVSEVPQLQTGWTND